MEIWYNEEERQTIIKEYESQGLVMLHDDFLPDENPPWRMTFEEPPPPTEEELYQEELAEKFNSGHEDLIRLIKNWPTMTKDQKLAASNLFVPYCAEWMLWKDDWLHKG